jgi:spore germination cell wall hydrolase CwlJ-like protein
MKTLKLGILCVVLPATLGLATIPQTATKWASTTDIDCLARNIYHEARGESIEGQLAVAQVTVNRVRSGKFQPTVCGVVHAHRQFSWTLDKRKKIKDSKAWQASKVIARAVLTQNIRLPNFEALYFHTHQVKPRWNRNKQVVAVIGNHIFYS